MSRVHDALRKAAQQERTEVPKPAPRVEPPPPFVPPSADGADSFTAPQAPASPVSSNYVTAAGMIDAGADLENLEAIIHSAAVSPYNPAKDALLVSPLNPREAPAEEFRTLRTRLNHMQTIQPLHTLVVTSASPAEGKSFTAMNLAVTQAQLADKRVLLADFDFRRPSVCKSFQLPGAPGITDYLLGKAPLGEVIRRIEGTNLYIMPAG